MKVKFMKSNNLENLSWAVNEFISRENIEVNNIQFSNPLVDFAVMVVYEEV